VPAAFDALVARRAAREPLAYITGTREFWSLPFQVSPAVLIPRAETETLIEAALAHVADHGQVRRVLDLGTGSGALLCAALAAFPAAAGIGIDRSVAAAMLARDNAVALGLGARARFVVGDWTAPLAGRFDLVLCNPPYVTETEVDGLAPELRHEPRTALAAGPDGLAAYRALLPGLVACLAPRGCAVVELGAGQARAVAALAAASGLRAASPLADLAGIPRALVLAAADPVAATLGLGMRDGAV
jgi:release factor glutamine methyltransferase